jgi:hypothetical protein
VARIIKYRISKEQYISLSVKNLPAAKERYVIGTVNWFVWLVIQ